LFSKFLRTLSSLVRRSSFSLFFELASANLKPKVLRSQSLRMNIQANINIFKFYVYFQLRHYFPFKLGHIIIIRNHFESCSF
jgi:hypothetical protein